MTDNERIAEWAGWTRDISGRHPSLWIAPKRGCWSGVPPFATDITLWHGPDGLRAEIEKKQLWKRFYSEWQYQFEGQLYSDMRATWEFRRAEPAQLTAALVKVIEENDALSKNPERG